MTGPFPPPADLDLRLVRCFTVVAEHLHFGHAAAALHLAQPSLSRHVRRLEGELGVRLFDRTPQGTRLTEAGEAFLPRAEALLRSAAQAAAQARAAAEPRGITIGFTTGLIVTPAVRELRRRHPDADVRTLHVAWNEPQQALLEERVDVVVARLPFPPDQLDVTVLYEEPRVLLLPVDHRLAGKEYVTLDDIVDEPLPRFPDDHWNAFWCVDPRPDGSRAPQGPLVTAIEDKLELIAAGQAVSLAPASSRTKGVRPDITTVPVEGIEPSRVVLATRAGEDNRLLTAFRTCAEAHLPDCNSPLTAAE